MEIADRVVAANFEGPEVQEERITPQAAIVPADPVVQADRAALVAIVVPVDHHQSR